MIKVILQSLKSGGSFRMSDERLDKYLIDNMDSKKSVKIPVSFTLLAKMLGLSRATLYRGLDTLEQKNKIKRDKNIIKVI